MSALDSSVIPLHRCAKLQPGDHAGPFVLLEKLGSGGMGEVFLAEHQLLGRRVALKVLHADHLRNPSMHERFTREARLANRVRHPNVVEITDQHALPDGRPYLTMELCEGVDIASHAREGLTLRRFVSILIGIVDALEAAHRAGVVHRDLKPSNILVDRDDRVKLLDFGVARLTSSEDDRLTMTGEVFGTPSYMSPEQATGEPVDGRSDLYSLGIIAWELLVGRRPFSGRSFGDFVLLHATMQPQPPSKATPRQMPEPIPPALDAIVLRCLAKRPEQRFQSAAELRQALAALIAPPAPSALSILAGIFGLAPPIGWRRIGIVATAALVVASLMVALFSGRHRPSQLPAPPSTTVWVLPPELIEAPVAPPNELPTFEPTIVEAKPEQPTFAPTIVEATHAGKRQKPRRVHASDRGDRGDSGAVASGELKDPFRAGQ
ncbi:MAG TPA: protein kinase [Polyangia bacterium]|nr:protein kinase [Polyangia bacterium]